MQIYCMIFKCKTIATWLHDFHMQNYWRAHGYKWRKKWKISTVKYVPFLCKPYNDHNCEEHFVELFILYYIIDENATHDRNVFKQRARNHVLQAIAKSPNTNFITSEVRLVISHFSKNKNIGCHGLVNELFKKYGLELKRTDTHFCLNKLCSLVHMPWPLTMECWFDKVIP